MEPKLLADILLAAGSLIGWSNKAYSLLDEQTTWSRKANRFNIAAFPFTVLLPFALIEVWFSFLVGLLNFGTWLGIYWFRAPEDEDLLGRSA